MKTASSVPDSDLVPSLDVLPFHERPCAAPGLVSYRYPTGSGSWIMIGAVDHDGALRQAARSLEVGTVTISKLEVWSGMGSGYVLAAPPLVPLSAPVGVSGVTLTDSTVKDTPAMTPEQAYEADRAAMPKYTNGDARPAWKDLSEIAKSTWVKNPTPRKWAAPASPVDSVGVPEPAYRVIESFTKRCTDPIDHDGELYGVIQGPEFALDVFSPAAMNMDAFKETLSVFAGNAASHDANLAKIKAMEESVKDLSQIISHIMHGGDAYLKDAKYREAIGYGLDAARAALALPSA